MKKNNPYRTRLIVLLSVFAAVLCLFGILLVHYQIVEGDSYRALSAAGTAKREVVDHPGGVSVAVLTAENELLFVKQFRCPYKEVLMELPAGKLEKGEDPFEAMKREQLEETGTTGKNYISLGNLYPTPGYCGEIIRLWACRVDQETGQLDLDPDEFLQTLRVPLDKAVEMVLNNEIPDSKTQVGVLKTAALVHKGLL